MAIPLLDRLHADAALVPLDYCLACRVDRADAPQSALSEHGDRLGLGQTLGLDRFETDVLLKRHRVTEQSLSHEDVDADVQSLNTFCPSTPDRTRPEGGVPRAEPRFCQDTARCGMLVDEERSRSIAGETAMVQPESKPATMEFEPPQSDLLDPNGDGHSVARNAQGDDLEDEVVLRGVVAIDISREVAARFSGMLILNELPERQPEVVFDSGRQFRDDRVTGGIERPSPRNP